MEYTYKCLQCGNIRTSYNDISLSTQSLIECKAKCYESHRKWEKVDTTMARQEERAPPPLMSNSGQSNKGSEGPSFCPAVQSHKSNPATNQPMACDKEDSRQPETASTIKKKKSCIML